MQEEADDEGAVPPSPGESFLLANVARTRAVTRDCSQDVLRNILVKSQIMNVLTTVAVAQTTHRSLIKSAMLPLPGNTTDITVLPERHNSSKAACAIQRCV